VKKIKSIKKVSPSKVIAKAKPVEIPLTISRKDFEKRIAALEKRVNDIQVIP
jgi:hypothetical protein